MKITDKMIKEYCKRMNYDLISIDRISFRYKKPDGSEAALLKGAVAHKPAVKANTEGWCSKCFRPKHKCECDYNEVRTA